MLEKSCGHLHTLEVFVKLDADHFTHADSPKPNRVADGQSISLTEIDGDLGRLFIHERQGHFHTRKIPQVWPLAGSRLHGKVLGSNDRLQSGQLVQSQLRSHDPELTSFPGEVFGRRLQPYMNPNALQFRSYFNPFHFTNVDTTISQTITRL